MPGTARTGMSGQFNECRTQQLSRADMGGRDCADRPATRNGDSEQALVSRSAA